VELGARGEAIDIDTADSGCLSRSQGTVMSSLGAGHSGTFKIGNTTINRIGYGNGQAITRPSSRRRSAPQIVGRNERRRKYPVSP